MSCRSETTSLLTGSLPSSTACRYSSISDRRLLRPRSACTRGSGNICSVKARAAPSVTRSANSAHLGFASDLGGKVADGLVLHVTQKMLHADFLSLGLSHRGWQMREYHLSFGSALGLDLLLSNVRVDWQPDVLGLRAQRAPASQPG